MKQKIFSTWDSVRYHPTIFSVFAYKDLHVRISSIFVLYIFRIIHLSNSLIWKLSRSEFIMEIMPDGSCVVESFLLMSWVDCRSCTRRMALPLSACLNNFHPTLPFCYITQWPCQGLYLLPFLLHNPTLSHFLCNILLVRTHAEAPAPMYTHKENTQFLCRCTNTPGTCTVDFHCIDKWSEICWLCLCKKTKIFSDTYIFKHSCSLVSVSSLSSCPAEIHFALKLII